MQVRFEEMGEQRKRFLAGYDRAVALLEQQRPAMVQSLDKGIAALGEDANSVLASLHSHAFVEATAEPPVVLRQLQGVGERLEQLQGKAESYNEMQRGLHMPPTAFTNLLSLKNEHALRVALWTCAPPARPPPARAPRRAARAPLDEVPPRAQAAGGVGPVPRWLDATPLVDAGLRPV